MPTIHTNGVRLYYESHGSENAPPLILNNGILMNAANSWAFQTKTLSKYYRVIQYDCRGQGQSDHPAHPYSMEEHARDIDGLMSELGIQRAHILGISYGGEIAQTFAAGYPGRVWSLVLADTVSEVGPELRLVVEGWRRSALGGDAAGLHEATVPWNFSARFIAQHPQMIADSRERYRHLDMAAVARLCDAFLQVDITHRLKEINVPTCILVGEEDKLKGRAYSEILHRHIMHSEFHILPGAGHASCWEKAEEFNSIVLGFLAKQTV